jgi:hypothetical protein
MFTMDNHLPQVVLGLQIWKSITFSNQQEQLGYQNVVSTNLHQGYVR